MHLGSHLGSATTLGTGSLPSRWYSFWSRERHAFEAMEEEDSLSPSFELYNKVEGCVPAHHSSSRL